MRKRLLECLDAIALWYLEYRYVPLRANRKKEKR